MQMQGRCTRIAIELTGDPGNGCPVLMPAETGISCFSTELRRSEWTPYRRYLHTLASTFGKRRDGLYFALVDAADGPRRLVLIQTERGAFKPRKPIPSDEGWRDFYYAVGRAAVDRADLLWGSSSLFVRHVSGEHVWTWDAAGAFLEGVRHLAGVRSVSLKTLYVDSLDERSAATLMRAVQRLDKEQPAAEPPLPEPVEVIDVPPAELGLDPSPGVAIFRASVRSA